MNFEQIRRVFGHEIMRRIAFLAAVTCVLFAGILPVTSTPAQQITIPNFWDPNERFVRPEIGTRQRVRFLTTTDFPPFNFIDRKKRLSGFHVDLARAICEELDIVQRCQIQALPWNELDTALEEDEGEAIIAGLAITDEARMKYDFSRPYLHIPGRFVVRNDSGITEPMFENLFQKRVGVVQGSGHERYFTEQFEGRTLERFATRRLAFTALRSGEIDAVFTDAVSGSFWLASGGADDCCSFAGGPFLSEEHFGLGLSIAVKKGDDSLKAAFDYALKAINDNGRFAELYLRYFPLGLF